MTNHVFEETKRQVLDLVENNVDLPAPELWALIQKNFPNVPKCVLASCLQELVSE